jgi:hypothetical protein
VVRGLVVEPAVARIPCPAVDEQDGCDRRRHPVARVGRDG